MRRLRVRLNETTVGFLDLVGDLSSFRFAQRYLVMADRPVLSRYYEDRLAPDYVDKRTQSRLPPFFENYLPEPNSPLRELLARRAGVPTNREFSLLEALGEDLAGAVFVEEIPMSAGFDDDAEPEPVSVPARGDALPDGPLRFSLAGMQLKFSVLEKDHKLTVPVTGVGGRYILKLPSGRVNGLPENEFSVMQWARSGGLEVPDVRLIRVGDVERLPVHVDPNQSALLVERYDRPRDGGRRIHQEDFAQVLGRHSDDKYGREGGVTFDRMGKIIYAVCGEQDLEEFLRRLTFVILARNPDAHLKNWSLWYRDPRRPRLAPAYDLVSTCAFPEITSELACRLADEWSLDEIRAAHFGKLAAHAGVDARRGVEIAESAAERFREAWRALRGELPMLPEQRDALDRHLATVKLP